MAKIDWAAQRKRKKEIEEQKIQDAKYQIRPAGKAPKVPLREDQSFLREEIVELAKENAVNVYVRPSHKRYDFD